MSWRWMVVMLGVLAGTTGCSAPSVQSYRNNKPSLDIDRFFAGETHAWGMFRDRQGQLIEQFSVDIQGQRQGNNLVLDEHFIYRDGHRQERIWTLQAQGDGTWRGWAKDVVGEARGEVAGNALHWRYDLKLPVDGREWIIHFDDWMFLQDDHTMLNQAHLSKFGVGLGDVSLFFRKESRHADDCAKPSKS